ncbi:GIY-YIG nuclease family protein [Mucilaginibacter angelicae]|uniref:GIY-YIG nuclease family protein n=1 Tax=Mucilaginibacter angelicae TaxID=869718 RepID=A0ABV6L199_9SPHI
MADNADDGTINNVITGIHPECFAFHLLDYEETVSYNLVYINGERELSGVLLQLSMHEGQRDNILGAYSFLIAEQYDKDPVTVYATFQEQTRTVYEKLGFVTVSYSEFSEIKDKEAIFILKDKKGIVPLAWIHRPDLFCFIFGKPALVVPVRGENYIYLMHNRRNNHFKIGKSWNPRHREKTLQSEAPEISMIAVWKASADTERLLHMNLKTEGLEGNGSS